VAATQDLVMDLISSMIRVEPYRSEEGESLPPAEAGADDRELEAESE
jgi:hypothetical protein